MNTVKCINSLSIVLCKHAILLVVDNLLYSFIAVLVVTSFNAKLYWSLNIFKNIHVLGNIFTFHVSLFRK